jgi:hypothetical protein
MREYENVVYKEAAKDKKRGLLWKILFYQSALTKNMF